MKKLVFTIIIAVSLISVVISAQKKVAVISQEDCTTCGLCFKNCAVKAISKVEKAGKISYLIDPQKCTACGTCIENCPVEAIELINFTGIKSAASATTDTSAKAPSDTVNEKKKTTKDSIKVIPKKDEKKKTDIKETKKSADTTKTSSGKKK